MKKIKRKGKVLALAFLFIYIGVIISNPSSWLILLPVMISALILTIGVPAYAIIKVSKEMLEEKAIINEESKKTDNMEQLTKIKEETKENRNDDIVDTIVNDSNISEEDKKEMLKLLKEEYQQDNMEKTKTIQKTKKRN